MTSILEIDDVSTASGVLEKMMHGQDVDSVNSSMPYNEFFAKYLTTNRPCVLRSSVTDDWPCRRKWQIDNAPNFQFLRQLFGTSIAPIADCTKKYYNSQLTRDMTLNDYLDYWITYRSTDYTNMPLQYLKDWHCIKNHPNIPVYEVPKYFASDWLNEYYINHPELNDDYMFVYMGPKGTWTPFHVDVFSSYSWSANIVGKKRWLLYEPGEESKMRNTCGQLIYDVDDDTLLDSTVYPKYDDATIKRYEIIQLPGEVVFVPSGWHHQVWNLEDTISINHNWINACNIRTVWSSLQMELLAVMREVDDCRDMDDWEECCQVMLKTSHGMNYIDFYKFLSFIAKRRLAVIASNKHIMQFNKWNLGKNHCLYELRQIKSVLEDLMEDAKIKGIYSTVFPQDEEFAHILKDLNDITR